MAGLAEWLVGRGWRGDAAAAGVTQLLRSPGFRRRSGSSLRCIRNLRVAVAECGALAGGSFPSLHSLILTPGLNSSTTSVSPSWWVCSVPLHRCKCVDSEDDAGRPPQQFLASDAADSQAGCGASRSRCKTLLELGQQQRRRGCSSTQQRWRQRQ